METKVETLEDGRLKVVATVDAADVDARIKKTYKDFANKYNFPGFRKGHAPRPVIDNALGKEAVVASVTDDVINDTYPLVIDQLRLYPLGHPQFDQADLVKGGQPYSFSFTVAVKPEIELDDYSPVAIDLPPAGATDTEVDEQIELLRQHYQTLEDAPANTKVKADSYVELSLEATDAAGEPVASLTSESRPYVLGSGLLPESFDENLVGLKKGQEAEFTIDVPDDAPVLLSGVQGKTDKLNFKVTVNAVKKEVLPELNDQWAKDTLGFDTLEAVREQVRNSIDAQKAAMLPRMKEGRILEALAARATAEAPEGMVEEAESNLLQDFFRQLQAQGMSFDMYLNQAGITPDQFKADVKQQAADVAKQDLALDAWAKHEGIEATDEDVVAEFAASGVEDPAKTVEEWRAAGNLHFVRQGILRTKAVTRLMDEAVVTEVEPGSEDEAPKAKKASKPKAKKAKKDAAEDEVAADIAEGDAAAAADVAAEAAAEQSAE